MNARIISYVLSDTENPSKVIPVQFHFCECMFDTYAILLLNPLYVCMAGTVAQLLLLWLAAIVILSLFIMLFPNTSVVCGVYVTTLDTTL